MSQSACKTSLLSARTCCMNIDFLWSNDLSATMFFFSNGRCWIFHWLSTLAKRRRGVGAASFFWRGREKTVSNTLEEDDWWVLRFYFSAWKLTMDLLFFHIFVPTEKKAACISDDADLLFPKISKYIYQTNFTLKMVNAHNNKPVLSNTSLACHNYCNHLFFLTSTRVQTAVYVF